MVTFTAGSTAGQTVNVTTLGDSLAEGGRDVHGDSDRLEPARRRVAGQVDGDGTIADDERPTGIGRGGRAEDASATFTVTLTGGTSTADVQVTYAVTGSNLPPGMSLGTSPTATGTITDDESLTGVDAGRRADGDRGRRRRHVHGVSDRRHEVPRTSR